MHATDADKVEHIALYFKQGSADKIYQAHLENKEDGWVVNFEYGRRGKPLQAGTKTIKPQRYDVAKVLFDRLVTAKMKKGYTPSSEGITYTNSPDAGRKTEFLPQLLNEVTREEAVRAFGQQSAMQIKHDGERRGVIIKKGKVVATNRKGLVTSMQQEIVNACLELGKDCELIMDTEDMGDHLVIFDLLFAGVSLMKEPFKERALSLKVVKKIILHRGLDKHLKIELPFFPKMIREAERFIEDAETAKEEGVVIRDAKAPYTPSRPYSGGSALKFKFYASATCRCNAIHGTKRSIELVLDDPILGIIGVGNCAIPVNHAMPSVGDMVEIKYMYANPGGSLYQPIYKGVRTDLTHAAATTTQLKYKKEN